MDPIQVERDLRELALRRRGRMRFLLWLRKVLRRP